MVNGKPYPPAKLEEFELLPGARDGIRELRLAGYLVIVVTNQPDVATGLQKPEVVESMHNMLLGQGLCDDIKVCYHTDENNCECRKPRPGMLLTAAKEWGIDLSQSYMVGDRWRDVDAGKAAGCKTFFIDYGYHESLRLKPDRMVTSLREAARIILQSSSRPPEIAWKAASTHLQS